MEVLDHVGAGSAQADDHAAFAELVERAEVLRQGGWRARVVVHDAGAELDAAGAFGQLREHREGVLAPGLGHEDAVDAGFVGNLHALERGLAVLVALPVESNA